MGESIIENLCSLNEINTLLDFSNFMDTALISCKNNCVVNPVSVHTAVGVDFYYWSIFYLMWILLKRCPLSFLGTILMSLLSHVVLIPF